MNEYGEIEGELAYATCGVDRYLCEDPERFGVFAKLNEKEILNIINKDYANENDSLINYEINADQFYKVSFATSPTNNGVIFMSSVKDTYPYGPKKGGIYERTCKEKWRYAFIIFKLLRKFVVRQRSF